jgi:hypothetical protein
MDNLQRTQVSRIAVTTAPWHNGDCDQQAQQEKGAVKACREIVRQGCSFQALTFVFLVLSFRMRQVGMSRHQPFTRC